VKPPAAAYVLAALLAAVTWRAGGAAAEPARSLVMRGAADAFAAAPSLHKFYVVRERRGGAGVLEARDARDARLLHVVRACARPVSLVANQTLARLYVLCTREVEDDVAASSLVTIDMRSDRTVGVVVLRDEAELHVAAEPDGTVVLAASRPSVLDPRTGRIVRTLRGAGRVIEVSGLAGMVLGWDRDERLLVLIARNGRVHGTFDPGLGRGPAGAAYDPSAQRLYVAFRDAGAIGVFDGTGALVRTLPVAAEPSVVHYDARHDRLIVLCDSAPGTHPALVTMRADGSERRTLVLTSAAAGRNDTRERVVFDGVTSRLAVAGSDALDIVDSEGPRIVATVQAPNRAQFVDMSAEAGTLAVAWSGPATTIDTFDLRSATVADVPRPAPAADSAVRMDRDASPPQDDPAPHFPVDPPRGVRSPRWIAFAPDGALIVASLGSGVLGRLRDGRYDERRLGLRAPAAGLAVDARGVVWLSEYARRDGSTSLARVAADGALREIALPRGFGGPGSTPVVGGGGDVWLYAPENGGRVARIDAGDRVHVAALPQHRSHIVDSARRIVALGDGVAVMDDRLWTVARDGTVRQLTAPVAVMPFTNLTAAADGTVSFAGREAVVDVAPDGGLVGTPLDELAVRTIETAQTRSTSTLCYPRDLARAADGTAWLTCGDTIAHVARDGTVRSFPLPDAQSAPASLVVAPDGAVWFTEPLHSRIGRLTPDGTLTETAI